MAGGKIMLPFSQAGIMGLSAGEKTGGIEVKPEHVLIASTVIVLILKAVQYLS
ncbi:MAG: hypothetical protein QW035_04135 [Candidatus Anstonellales archaeon]